MRRMNSLSMLVGLLLVLGACGGELGATAGLPIPPTSTTTTTNPPTTVEVQDSVSVSEPAPQVLLSNGELVPLFEEFDHDNFGDPTTIDNSWLPMRPGTRMVYEGFTAEDGEVIPHRLVFTVTDLTKVIDGVESVVIWDLDFSDGELVETELAFFAQDDSGNVWRMGEYPEEWEEGEFIEAPTWIAGVAKARAGIAMSRSQRLEAPSYSQGWGPAVDFSDRAFVYEIGTQTCVVFDCFRNVLVIDEFNDEEPGAHQLKYYAEDVGNIRVGWRGDDQSIEELELVEMIQLTPEELVKVREGAMILEERAYILSEDVYGKTDRAQAP